ncbi:hypothetical protein K6119_01115 [Paracrocinitomix mangrovi]|uniref:hypothetical protein n=1 Tax=Paracrocinitomix mangrovi TaxID=2862509 RepID=UPI001C8D830C|nr:hypothetical protein [Paracrocinitomix mangrovi]UKN02115.1 hypothetical protein K6119_01115 [Paracrocinitomix mangrovi]
MKNILVISVFSLICFNTQAQFDIDPGKIIDKMFGTPVESDRPGQAMNPNTAGILTLQLQTGFNYTSFNADKIYQFKNYGVPTQIRLGITKKIELNTSFSYNYSRHMSSSFDTTFSGFPSPNLGIRYNPYDGDRWKPYLGFQANLSFLSHKGDYRQQNFGSSFYVMTSNRFEVVSFNTNLGVVFQGNDLMQPAFPWVLNFGFKIGKKWNTFIEGFGDFSNLDLNADAGFSYTPINDLQIDLFGGWLGDNFADPYWFIEGGITYKISFMKMIAKKKAKGFLDQMKN